MFGLVGIVFTLTMLGNAVCILHEERFLKNLGVAKTSKNPIAKQLADLVGTMKTLCVVPLCILNCIFMLYELFLG